MKKRRWAAYSVSLALVCLIALYFMLNMTNPSDSGPAGIAVVLLLIYGLSLGVILLMALIGWFVTGLVRAKEPEPSDELKTRHEAKRMLMICAALAVAPILVISLNSIGRISLLDIALIAATEAVAVFYISCKV